MDSVRRFPFDSRCRNLKREVISLGQLPFSEGTICHPCLAFLRRSRPLHKLITIFPRLLKDLIANDKESVTFEWTRIGENPPPIKRRELIRPERFAPHIQGRILLQKTTTDPTPGHILPDPVFADDVAFPRPGILPTPINSLKTIRKRLGHQVVFGQIKDCDYKYKAEDSFHRMIHHLDNQKLFVLLDVPNHLILGYGSKSHGGQTQPTG